MPTDLRPHPRNIAQPRFAWNIGAARYIDARTGKFVSQREIRRVIDRVLLRGDTEVLALSKDLQKGKIGIEEWQTGMMQTVNRVQKTSAMAGAGGWANMTQGDIAFVEERLTSDYLNLERFAGQIDRGLPLDGRFLNRSRMYSQGGRGTYHQIERKHNAWAGMRYERNVLGPADHCTSCVGQTARGWVRIGRLTPIGMRECLTNCQCSVEYSSKLFQKGVEVGPHIVSSPVTTIVTRAIRLMVARRVAGFAWNVWKMHTGLTPGASFAWAMVGLRERALAKRAARADTPEDQPTVEVSSRPMTAEERMELWVTQEGDEILVRHRRLLEAPDAATARRNYDEAKRIEAEAIAALRAAERQAAGLPEEIPPGAQTFRIVDDEELVYLATGDGPTEESWFYQHWNKWVDSLTPDETIALREYQARYDQINRGLRQGDIDAGMLEEVLFLDSAITKGNLPESVTLYRGAKHAPFRDLVEGDIFYDKAFLSTSLSEETALHALRAQRGDADSQVVFRIRAPIGTKAAFVEHAVGVLTDLPEAEILLARGTGLRVLRVHEIDDQGVRYIDVDLVSPDADAFPDRNPLIDWEFEDWHGSRWADHMIDPDGITSDHIEAFDIWTATPAPYKVINAILRGENVDNLFELNPYALDDLLGWAQSHFNLDDLPDFANMEFDEIIEEGSEWARDVGIPYLREHIPVLLDLVNRGRVPRDLTLYRGGVLQMGDHQVGTVITTKGLTSTSLRENHAEAYILPDDEDLDEIVALFRIDVPEGTPGLYTKVIASPHYDQDEVIFPPGTMFRIAEDLGEDEWGQRSFRVEIVDPAKGDASWGAMDDMWPSEEEAERLIAELFDDRFRFDRVRWSPDGRWVIKYVGDDSNPDAEEGAYNIARAMGLGHRVIPQRAYSYSSEWYLFGPAVSDADQLAARFWSYHVDPDAPRATLNDLKTTEAELKKFVLFEYLIKAEDRHGYNYLVGPDGFVALDFEQSFDFQGRSLPFFWVGISDLTNQIWPDGIDAVLFDADIVREVLRSRERILGVLPDYMQETTRLRLAYLAGQLDKAADELTPGIRGVVLRPPWEHPLNEGWDDLDDLDRAIAMNVDANLNDFASIDAFIDEVAENGYWTRRWHAQHITPEDANAMQRGLLPDIFVEDWKMALREGPDVLSERDAKRALEVWGTVDAYEQQGLDYFLINKRARGMSVDEMVADSQIRPYGQLMIERQWGEELEEELVRRGFDLELLLYAQGDELAEIRSVTNEFFDAKFRGWVEAKVEEIDRIIPGLDAVIAKGRAPTNIVAYRGIRDDPRFEVGQEFVDPGFGATSLNRSQALIYSGEEVDLADRLVGSLFEIHIPRGHPAAYLEAIDPGEHRHRQWEVLLPRDQQFRVTAIRDDAFDEINAPGYYVRTYVLEPTNRPVRAPYDPSDPMPFLRWEDDEFQDALRGWETKATEPQKAAAEFWSEDSWQFNIPLREGKKLDKFDQEQVARLDELVEEHTLPTNMILWRGMNDKGLVDDIEKGFFKEGDVIDDPGFAATSPRQGIASYFMEGKEGMEGAIMVEIRAKAGQKGVALDKIVYGANAEKVGESEILLPRHTRFRIVEIRHRAESWGRVTHIIAEIDEETAKLAEDVPRIFNVPDEDEARRFVDMLAEKKVEPVMTGFTDITATMGENGAAVRQSVDALWPRVVDMTGDTPEVVRSKIEAVLQTWNYGSFFGPSGAVREAVKRVFPHRVTRHYRDVGDSLIQQYEGMAKDEYREHRRFYDSFVQAQYEATQDWFRQQRATHITLYRAQVRKKGAAVTGELLRDEWMARPLQSMTVSPEVAQAFARKYWRGMNRDEDVVEILAVRVPVEQVFATPRTGIGVLGQSEFTIFGGRYEALAMRWDGRATPDIEEFNHELRFYKDTQADEFPRNPDRFPLRSTLSRHKVYLDEEGELWDEESIEDFIREVGEEPEFIGEFDQYEFSFEDRNGNYVGEVRITNQYNGEPLDRGVWRVEGISVAMSARREGIATEIYDELAQWGEANNAVVYTVPDDLTHEGLRLFPHRVTTGRLGVDTSLEFEDPVRTDMFEVRARPILGAPIRTIRNPLEGGGERITFEYHHTLLGGEEMVEDVGRLVVVGKDGFYRVEHVEIWEDYRGHGLSMNLYDEAARWAAENNVRIYSTVDEMSEAAQTVLERRIATGRVGPEIEVPEFPGPVREILLPAIADEFQDPDIFPLIPRLRVGVSDIQGLPEKIDPDISTLHVEFMAAMHPDREAGYIRIRKIKGDEWSVSMIATLGPKRVGIATEMYDQMAIWAEKQGIKIYTIPNELLQRGEAMVGYREATGRLGPLEWPDAGSEGAPRLGGGRRQILPPSYRRAKTKAEANEIILGWQGGRDLSQDLDGLQRQVLEKYVEGTTYFDINWYLRRGQSHPGGMSEDNILKHKEVLESAILTARPVSENLVLYRRFADPDIFDGIEEGRIGPGHIIIDKGFASTSLDDKIPLAFLERKSTIVEIHVPEGARAIPVDAGMGYSLYGQSEILLPPGSRFRVKHILEERVLDDGVPGYEIRYKRIVVQLLPPEADEFPDIERVFAAAVRVSDKDGKVVRTFEDASHPMAYNQMEDWLESTGKTLDDFEIETDGFTTTTGRYVDGEEATVIARRNRQVDEEYTGVLGSEDTKGLLVEDYEDFLERLDDYDEDLWGTADEFPRNPDRFPLSRTVRKIEGGGFILRFKDRHGNDIGKAIVAKSDDDPYDFVVEYIQSDVDREGVGTEMYDELARWADNEGYRIFTIPEQLTSDGQNLFVHRLNTGRVGLSEVIEWDGVPWQMRQIQAPSSDASMLEGPYSYGRKEAWLSGVRIIEADEEALRAKVFPRDRAHPDFDKPSPFMGGRYQIKRIRHSSNDIKHYVFDDDSLVGTYDGDILVVEPRYRRQGVATELVADFRGRYPTLALPATVRTARAQRVHERAHRLLVERAIRGGYLDRHPDYPDLTPDRGFVNPVAQRKIHSYDEEPWVEQQPIDYWYHGTQQMDEFEFIETPPQRTTGHWNIYLGNHFASDYYTAKRFADGMYGSAGSPGRVIATRLRVRNPIHFGTELEMDRAFWKFANERHLQHKDVLHLNKALGEEWQQLNWAPGDIIAQLPPERQAFMARAWRRHLEGMGYDAITYTNRVEGGELERSVVVLRPSRIDIEDQDWKPEKFSPPPPREISPPQRVIRGESTLDYTDYTTARDDIAEAERLFDKGLFTDTHKQWAKPLIRQMLEAGEPVPRRIMKMYPDLMKEFGVPDESGKRIVTVEEYYRRKAKLDIAKNRLVLLQRRGGAPDDIRKAEERVIAARKDLESVTTTIETAPIGETRQKVTYIQETEHPFGRRPRKPSQARPTDRRISALQARIAELRRRIKEAEAQDLDVDIYGAELRIARYEAEIGEITQESNRIPILDIPRATGIPESPGRASTVQEAVDQFKALGVQIQKPKAEYREGLLLMNAAIEIMADLKKKGLKIPKSVQFIDFEKGGPNGRYFVDYDAVLINLDGMLKSIDEARDTMKSYYRGRWTSTDSPFGVIYHELGHAAHYGAIGKRRYEELRSHVYTQYEEAVVKMVTYNSVRSPLEFVADVFTGLISGKQYPDEVMALYEQFGGPHIPGRMP